MRGTKLIPQPKKDVETLELDMLMEVASLKEHPGFGAVDTLMKDFIRRRMEELMLGADGVKFEQLGINIYNVSQMRLALEYFLDTPARAVEEIKRRNGESTK